MSWNDSWDNEPAPAQDSWDTWDTPVVPPSNFGNGGKGNFGGGFSGKGNFGGFDNGKGNFGKGDFGKGQNDFGKGNFGKGPIDFGKGPGMNSFDGGKGFDGNFGQGPMDFGKGQMDFGKGGMDFGKGPPDFGKGGMDFGKGPIDFGKGGFDDFSKGCGKDFSKGMGTDNFSLKGALGKNDFSDNSFMPMNNKGGFEGKGIVLPPGAAPKMQATGQFVPAPPMPFQPMGKGGAVIQPPQKGAFNPAFFPDGGKGAFNPAFKGAVNPAFNQAFVVPPPPPGTLMPQVPNGTNMTPFAKAPQFAGGIAPDMLALTEAENVTLMDDAPGKAIPSADGRKPRLFLLLTRLSPDLKSEHMQQILEQCGEVQAFRRARDPSGQPLSFGFAHFADPEAAWKASTCISKLVLCGSEIKVLLEEQTEVLINSWRTAQQAALKVASNEELEWELERKSVSCKSAVDAKVEEIYGTGKGGAAASKRRQELREKEQARVLRNRKRKAWREDQFATELERVQNWEKRLRREEKARDGMDRKKEELHRPQAVGKEESMLTAAKKEDGDSGGPVEPVAVSNDNRVLCDLVDKIQSEPRDAIFKMDLDVTHLRNEKTFDKKLRPWLEKRIDLFMGGPQSDLVEYVLRRVNGAISADALISDLSRFLDDNAESLVERMWRMLIFELMRCGLPMGVNKGEKARKLSRLS